MEEPKPKDSWDKLDIFAKLIIGLATICIATIGGVFTHTYNQRQLAQSAEQIKHDTESKDRQNRMLELQTVETFFVHLLAKDETEKEAALETIKQLKNQELYMRLNTIFGTKSTESSVNEIMASNYVSQEQVPEKIAEPIAKTPDKTQQKTTHIGWAYLGHFSEKDEAWKTRYFKEIAEKQKPLTLKNETLTVNKATGDLNVRENMPDWKAQFFKVLDVIPPGKQVTVREVKQWYSSGYWWAKIEY